MITREHNTGRYPKSCPSCAKFAAERSVRIYSRRRAGRTYREIAEEFHISKERVRQILHRENRRIAREEWLRTRPVPTPELLQMDVSQLPASIRAYNGLVMSGVKTIGELIKMTEGDILRTRNFGRKTLEEIREGLAEMGLVLAEEKAA